MNLPKTLPLPSVDDYPFINLEMNILWGNADHRADYFEHASCVSDTQLIPLESMTPETFMEIIGVLNLKLFDTVIRSKEILAKLAVDKNDLFLDDFEMNPLPHFSQEQLQCFLLYSALPSSQPYWKHLVNAYNKLEPGQQTAVDEFFRNVLNINLEGLITIKGPRIEVPFDLYSKNERILNHGDTHYFCEISKSWMREDVFTRQFEVNVITNTRDTVQIACAGTLEAALIKATVFANKQTVVNSDWGSHIAYAHEEYTSQKVKLDNVHIRRNGIKLASAEVKYEMDQAGDDYIWETKLNWINNYIDPLVEVALFNNQSYLEQADKLNESGDLDTEKRFREQISDIYDFLVKNHKFEPSDVTELIYKAEEKLGIKRTVAKHFEEDLGL